MKISCFRTVHSGIFCWDRTGCLEIACVQDVEGKHEAKVRIDIARKVRVQYHIFLDHPFPNITHYVCQQNWWFTCLNLRPQSVELCRSTKAAARKSDRQNSGPTTRIACGTLKPTSNNALSIETSERLSHTTIDWGELGYLSSPTKLQPHNAIYLSYLRNEMVAFKIRKRLSDLAFQ